MKRRCFYPALAFWGQVKIFCFHKFSLQIPECGVPACNSPKICVYSQNDLADIRSEKDTKTSNALQPFIDIHHARICEQPTAISSNPAQKKLTWEKIKILKSSE
jgi:hypothetical protein